MTVQWRKSSRSGGVNDSACVEVAGAPEGVGLRDSKDPDGGHLVVSGRDFAALVDRIKDGVLDRPC
jgi:hypothetical protein